MYKRLLVIVGLVLVTSLFSIKPANADAQDFTIKSFSADYHLSRDADRISHMQVREAIVAEFPNYEQNHGILRAIPQKYQDHSVELDVQSVTNQAGSPLEFTTYNQNDNLVLKIGQPDQFVYGEQTYIIKYDMRSVTANFSDHSELYWDVNGDQWQQPFGVVQARVHIPNEIATSLQARQVCFTGKKGSTEQQCTINRSKNASETVVAISALNLKPQETLSFVLGFEQDSFAPHKPSQQETSDFISFAALVSAPPLLAAAAMFYFWRRFGRSPKGTIVPQYLPPKQFSVLASSIVLAEGFMPKAVSATIIDLAVRHYIKIYEHKNKKLFKDKITYKLELIKDPKSLMNEELKVVRMLFSTSANVGSKINLETRKNKLYTKAKKLGDELIGRLVTENYLKRKPVQTKLPYIIVGIILLAIGTFSVAFGQFSMFGFMAAGFIVLIGAPFMSARTAKGTELKNYLLGLKSYIQLAETERLKILQSPHGKLTEKIDVTDKIQLVKLYEKLLPYAMLFGLEKNWAQEFAHLYQQSPVWYHGSDGFQAAHFAGAISNFSQASAVSFAPSGSSSSSGFSGGGAAGGGGGGGGGGGW